MCNNIYICAQYTTCQCNSGSKLLLCFSTCFSNCFCACPLVSPIESCSLGSLVLKDSAQFHTSSVHAH